VERLATAAILALGLAGAAGSSIACKSTQTASEQADDAGIKASVKAKLAEDVRFSTLTNIEVNSTNGVVTLAGQVHNFDEKRAAERVAASVKGVKKVNNELQIEKPPGK
jgi:hyperosmotically inducible protein